MKGRAVAKGLEPARPWRIMSRRRPGPLAQRSEQWTHNPLVEGSNPSGPSDERSSKRSLCLPARRPTPAGRIHSAPKSKAFADARHGSLDPRAWTHPTPRRPVSARFLSLSAETLCLLGRPPSASKAPQILDAKAPAENLPILVAPGSKPHVRSCKCSCEPLDQGW